MKKRYLLTFLQGACFMILSVLLQSCGGPGNLPLEGEGESTDTIEQGGEQGRRKRSRIEMGEEESEEQRLIEQEVSSFDIFPSEIWQKIFSHLDFEGVLSARAVNRDWSELITGFRKVGIVGVENKPQYMIDTQSWTSKKEIDFRNNKLFKSIPKTIPSFAFYHLMGKVKGLPKLFWPYLEGTQVHTLDLDENEIGDAGAIELARALPRTQVHTLYLWGNEIGDAIGQLLVEEYPHINWRF
ncbi:MAG: F-box-like domain-containing protein [Candidatus Amoebophilus sp.]